MQPIEDIIYPFEGKYYRRPGMYEEIRLCGDGPFADRHPLNRQFQESPDIVLKDLLFIGV